MGSSQRSKLGRRMRSPGSNARQKRAHDQLRSDMERLKALDISPLGNNSDDNFLFSVKREAVSFTKEYELRKFLDLMGENPTVEVIQYLGLSILRRSEVANMAKVFGRDLSSMYDDARAYCDNELASTMSARIGGYIVTGVDRHQKGERYISLLLCRDDRRLIAEERVDLLGRLGVNSLTNFTPHISLVMTRDQGVVEDSLIHLKDSGIVGSAVMFATPRPILSNIARARPSL